MIDIENEVFTRISNAILNDFPTADVTSEYVATPPSFPHISVIMSDNRVDKQYTTLESEVSTVNFTVEVYSNKMNGKKSECKRIAKVIDKEMFAMNFTRTFYSPLLNMNNASIYRLTMHYTANIDGKYFYRR